jgi:hypothetical protein
VNHKQLCVANVQYKKPTVDDAKRQKGLLRYLTYREGRHGPAIQETGRDRWRDYGLGRSVAEIARRCEQYRSDHVLAFTLVFNTNPELMAMVPVELREAFVCELTETALDCFFEARGLEGGVEYSYVLHHRDSENREAPGLHDPHSHVLLPGTVFDEGEGERSPLYFSRNRHENHVELLHRVTEGVMVQQMERYVGPDWEERYDALETIRDQQRQIIVAEPHGGIIDEQERTWPLWFGARRTDEQSTAVGYYRFYPVDTRSTQAEFEPEELELEFRPVTAGLTHERADQLARLTGDYAHRHPEADLAELMALIQHIGSLSPDEQDRFLGNRPELPTVTQQEEEQAQPSMGGLSIDF